MIFQSMSESRMFKKKDFVWLPDSSEELLLKAGLEKGATAIAAWLEYKAKIDLLKITEAERRLLPLVYHNLRQHEFTDELTDFLKNTHRAAHRKTTFELCRAAELTALLT